MVTRDDLLKVARELDFLVVMIPLSAENTQHRRRESCSPP